MCGAAPNAQGVHQCSSSGVGAQRLGVMDASLRCRCAPAHRRPCSARPSCLIPRDQPLKRSNAMNDMENGLRPFASPPGEAEDRFTSEGGAVRPRHPAPAPTESRSIVSAEQRSHRAGGSGVVKQPRASAQLPTPGQLELMQDMNVDFCQGSYLHEHQRFLRFEDAIDCAETARRTRARHGEQRCQ